MPPKQRVPVSKKTPVRGKVTSVGRQAAPEKRVGPVRASGGAVPSKKTSGATATQSKTKKPAVWNKEDDMARKIQSAYRGYKSRKLLLELRKKKADYDDTIEKLQRQAYLQLVKMEQERAAVERMREDEARKKKHEETQRIKRFLEAAFDGDNDEIQMILDEVANIYAKTGESTVKCFQYKMVECSDPNSNTALSEASAGGHPLTVNFLIKQGANPNVKGQYGRTPLYRAAFAGHKDAVKVLLESGADPRIHADDGATPEQVASGDEVQHLLQEWDICQTEKLLVILDEKRKQKQEIDEKLWLTQKDELQIEIEKAEKEYSAKRRELIKANEELNKRINEHDENKLAKPELTLTAIHDAEDILEQCKLHAESAKKKLQEAKLKMRVKKKEFHSGIENEEDNQELSIINITVNIREMDDVLMKDVGNKIAESNKWPLILDHGRQCATFLMYRDTNYLNAMNPRHMEAETIRKNLLGAIRYGKFAVIDLSDIDDLWPAIIKKFDAVQLELLPSLISKDFLTQQRYLKLIKASDGDEYSANSFLSARVHNFKLVIVTQLPASPPELVGLTYVIKVHTPEPSIY